MSSGNKVQPEASFIEENGLSTTKSCSLNLETVPDLWHHSVSKWIRKNVILVATFFAVIFAVAVGVLLREVTNFDEKGKLILQIPGELFIRILKLAIIPLISSSIISGLSRMDVKQSGRIGLYALLYYFSTTIIAVTEGMILVNLIRPGDAERWSGSNSNSTKSDESSKTQDSDCTEAIYVIYDILMNLFPSNIVKVGFTQAKTTGCNATTGLKHDEDVVGEPNFLGLITVSICFGIVLNLMTPKDGNDVLKQLFERMEVVVMQIIKYIMWYSPIGIFFLIVSSVVGMEEGELESEFVGLAVFTMTVVVGLSIHAFIVLPSLFFFVTRRNPYSYMRGVVSAMLTALGTSSSAVTLPTTILCLEDKLHVDSRVVRLMLPIGATVNMDGSALYQATAAMYTAYRSGLAQNMGFGNQILICLTATLASIGTAAIPNAGVMNLLLIISAVGLPVDGVKYLLAIDWINDRLCTTVNVTGDAFGAGIVYTLCKKQLDKRDENCPDAQYTVVDLEVLKE